MLVDLNGNVYLENGDEELEINVDYDYQPEEPEESSVARHHYYPGCDADVTVNEVTYNGCELCLLADAESELEESLLEYELSKTTWCK